MANLMLKPDKGLLEELITQAEGLNEADYDVESFTVMRFDDNATQEEVETSMAALGNAIAKLAPAEGGDDNKTAAGQDQNSGSSDKNNSSSSAGKTQAADNSAAKAVKTGDTADVFPFAAAAVAAGAVMLAACTAVLGKKRR